MDPLSKALQDAIRQPTLPPAPLQPSTAAPSFESPRASASKRKDTPGDDDGPEKRSKRSRYISIACNECKRRKIKCNGDNPCQRCGNLSLDCVYAPNCCSNNFKDTGEYKAMTVHLASLQDQVTFLLANLNQLRGALGQEMFTNEDIYYHSQVNQASAAALAAPTTTVAATAALVDPTLQARKQTSNQPRFQGPTSPAFSLGLARSSLQSMGITGTDEAVDDIREAIAAEIARNPQESSTNQRQQPQSQSQSQSDQVSRHPQSRDPLWILNKEEMLRLCAVYEDEIGVMNPLFDIQEVRSHATLLYSFIDAAARNMAPGTQTGPDEIHDESTDLLRLILAIALVAEGTGQSELGQKLFDSVNQARNFRMVHSPALKDVQLVVLMAIYHFHVDNEDLAWRVIGLAARLSLEMGLHRSETYEKHITTEPARSTSLKVFWCIYVLDRRWSYGTGRGFALQESDIDSSLPRPADSSPYLHCMIAFTAISTKTWKYIAAVEADGGPGNELTRTEVPYLEYEIMQWSRLLPDQFRYLHPGSVDYTQHQHTPDPNEADGRVMYKLRVILHLRANQARLSIYRPILSSATSILTGSPDFAQTAVDVAKDTIRMLHHINQTSDLYRTAQMTFNYFLLSALAVLFLAVSHAPAQFAEACREEFYLALDLVRGLSAHSYVSKRLWRTIRGLKEVGPKIGLYVAADAVGDVSGTSTGGTATRPASALSQKAAVSQLVNAQHAPPHRQNVHSHASNAMSIAALAGHTNTLPTNTNTNTHNNNNSTNHLPRVDDPNCVFFRGPPPNERGGDMQQHASASVPGINARGGPELVASPNVMANDLTNLFEAAGIFARGNEAVTMQAAAFARDGLVGGGGGAGGGGGGGGSGGRMTNTSGGGNYQAGHGNVLGNGMQDRKHVGMGMEPEGALGRMNGAGPSLLERGVPTIGQPQGTGTEEQLTRVMREMF